MRNAFARQITALDRLIDFMVGFLAENQDFIRIVFREVLLKDSPIGAGVAAMMSGNHALLVQILEQARTEGRLRDVDPHKSRMIMDEIERGGDKLKQGEAINTWSGIASYLQQQKNA